MRPCGDRYKGWLSTLLVCGLWGAFVPVARSQEAGATDPPRPPSPTPAAPITVEQLAERLRLMEETNRKLAQELDRTRKEHDQQIKQLLEKVGELSGKPSDARTAAPPNGSLGDVAAPLRDALEADDPGDPAPDYTEGQFAPYSPPPGYKPLKIPSTSRLPLRGTFGPGFQFLTEDEEYRLQVHYESQIDARVWSQRDQVPANSGIYLPRQRIFFNGNITRPIEYEFSINRGLGGLNLLNAYINIHFDDRLELRIGRYFTPFDYDQYAISNYWLPTPERSLFTTNLGLNRQFGAMAWGYLFEKRLDYAAGVFNGSRNSFEPLSNNPDFVGYLNARPFQETESDTLAFLKFLNLGTSLGYGYQDQSPVPMAFRIAAASPNGDTPGPGVTPFLMLNPGVVERGQRLVGSVHAAYFYKSLSLIGEWQYGYGSYATGDRPSPVAVPVSGFYATAGYFLTGENVERRARVSPLRPFLQPGKRGVRGPGAWEAVARVSELQLGERIFTGGFADPNLWSRSAITTEVGLNWYWNEYIKIYMFWLHGEFGDPVQYRPGGYQKTADMLWMRFQLYF